MSAYPTDIAIAPAIPLLHMARGSLVAPFLAFCALMFGAVATPSAAKPIFPPGSAWGIEPPPGFRISTSGGFSFEHPSGAMILAVSSQRPHDRAKVATAGTQAGAGDSAIRIDSVSDVMVGARPGILMVAHGLNQPFQMLVLMIQGDTAGTLTAVMPDAARGVVDIGAVRRALFSAQERRLGAMEQLAALPIRVSQLDGMRISSMVGTLGVVLTDGSENETGKGLKQAFVTLVAQSAEGGAPYQPGRDDRLFARNIETSFDGTKVLSTQTRSLPGGPVIEASLEGTKDGSVRSGLAWVKTIGGFNVFLLIQAPVGQPADAVRLERIFLGIAAK